MFSQKKQNINHKHKFILIYNHKALFQLKMASRILCPFIFLTCFKATLVYEYTKRISFFAQRQ